jgi:plasmid stabilization system protein ParE
MSGYRLTEPARDHIRSIWQQIVPESRIGANRVVDRIIASCDHLGTFQTEGEEWPGRPVGMRYYSVPNTRYLIVFAPDTDPVEIVAVVDASRHLPDVSLT